VTPSTRTRSSYLGAYTGHGRAARIASGDLLVSDGPFAETKEQIAGYDIIECADLQEAIEVAGKHPTTRPGTIEIRPFPPEG
jgi:hypothetical protein